MAKSRNVDRKLHVVSNGIRKAKGKAKKLIITTVQQGRTLMLKCIELYYSLKVLENQARMADNELLIEIKTRKPQILWGFLLELWFA